METNFTFGIFLLLLVDFIWVLSSELTTYIFKELNYDKPFFSTFLKTCIFSVFLLKNIYQFFGYHGYDVVNDSEEDEEELLSPSAFVPVESDEDEGNQSQVKFSKVKEVRMLPQKTAPYATLSRMSHEATTNFISSARFSNVETLKIALTFSFLWFPANYFYQLALTTTTVSMVNVLSSSSAFFTLFLSSLFPSSEADKFTASKLVCVLISVCGVISVSCSHGDFDGNFLGILYSIFSAGCYAVYLVFLKRSARDGFDLIGFFGYVGLTTCLFLWPFFIILNYTGMETWELPDSNQFIYILLNGLLGTLFSELLWVWGTLHTTPLISTLAISLTIPFSLFADVIFRSATFNFLFIFGSISMVFSFCTISIVTSYGIDPVRDLFK